MFASSRLNPKTALLGLAVAALLVGCGKKGKVYFGNLSDGAEVESPFTVEMRAENLTVEPATAGVRDGHGHFHILVDVPVPRTLDPIPNDERHIHYGEGETEAVLDLPEGEHTLILQFAKGDHRPYDPQILQEIRVRVTRRNAPDGLPGNGLGPDGRGAPGSGSHADMHGGTGIGGAGAADSQHTGDPRNIQPGPGAGSTPSAGGSSGSGASGGAAL